MPSQYGQDQLVIDLLNGKRNGFFFDIGASDGIKSSNTEMLERDFGWRGLCVDANTCFYEKLRRNRRCVCLNACLYDHVADLPFLEAAGTLGGLFEVFDREQLAYALKHNTFTLDEAGMPPLVTKRTMTIASALEMANAPPVIDYWSLDTEGTELRLLQSFPFDRYTFNVLTVEHNNQPIRVELRRFLEARGFALVTTLFIDDCYIRTAAFPDRHRQSAVWRRGWRGR